MFSVLSLPTFADEGTSLPSITYETGYLAPGSMDGVPTVYVCDGCAEPVTQGAIRYAFPRAQFHAALYHGDCWARAHVGAS